MVLLLMILAETVGAIGETDRLTRIIVSLTWTSMAVKIHAIVSRVYEFLSVMDDDS